MPQCLPMARHTVAVIVQDGAEPFGLGSLVEVWGEPEHPEDETPVFDFRVCTPRPGRVKGRSDFDMYVERGLEATADADLVCLVAPLRLPQPRRRRARGGPGGQRPRRDPLRALLGVLRARCGRPARRPRVHHPLALHRPARADCTPRPRSSPTSSTATTATSSPVPARRPGSTRRCTSCATSTAPAWPRRRPAGSSCPRTATAARPSSSSAPSPTATARRSDRCSSGSSATSTRTSTSTPSPASR